MIRKIGIIGCGKMGSDIFNYLSDYSFQLVWYSLFEEEKEQLEKSFHKKNLRQLKHNLISQDQFNFRNTFKITNSLFDFSDCDLIIESISEKLDDKKELFKYLEQIVSKKCILCSNSSSFLPSKLHQSNPIYGLHFFYPVSFKSTVELVIPNNDVDECTEILKSFLKMINKKVFIQDESKAFLLNRFLLDIQIKALDLVFKFSIPFQQMDQIAKRIIPDFGLFEMMDQVGLKTMYNSVCNYANMSDNKDIFSPIIQELRIRNDAGSSFYENEKKQSIALGIENEIYSKLLQEVIQAVDYFVTAYDLDKKEFETYLNDFCGLEL